MIPVFALSLVASIQPPLSMQGPVPKSFHKDVAALRAEREALLPLCESELARAFLGAIDHLPSPSPRVLYWRTKPNAVFTEAEAEAAFATEELADLRLLEWGEAEYYAPLFGTPLAYVRPLDLLASHGVEELAEKRVLDFGYGGICQLRLFALLGADAVGVDVSDFLRALYTRDEDQGPLAAPDGPEGSVTLAHGSWPGDREVAAAVGGGFDLVLARNVLKRGFVHPEEGRTHVDLGLEDEQFLAALFEALAPGGLAFVYNLGYEPPGPDEAYRPQDDIGSAFDRAEWESAGFELVAFDADDSEAARAHGAGYGWGAGAERLRASWTLARRPR